MKNALFFLLSLGLYQSAAAQFTLTGTVIDSASRQPIEYANVIDMSANRVVYTDENGRFEIAVNGKEDRIQVTNMGYRSRQLTDLAPTENLIITLAEAPILIDEVAIKKRKLSRRSEEMGFHQDETASRAWGPGGEIANTFVVHIKNTADAEGEIAKAYFKLGKYIVGRNGFSKARVRIMQVDPQTGLPGGDLLRENNIVKINPVSQSFTINVEKYRITFPKEGVFVGLEFFCQTDKKETGRGHYTVKSNCPHIASTTAPDYKTRGASYYHYFDFRTKAWKWVGITNGELSKAFTNDVFKFGLRANFYE